MEIHVLFCRPILDATRIILVYDDVILREALCAGLGFWRAVMGNVSSIYEHANIFLFCSAI